MLGEQGIWTRRRQLRIGSRKFGARAWKIVQLSPECLCVCVAVELSSSGSSSTARIWGRAYADRKITLEYPDKEEVIALQALNRSVMGLSPVLSVLYRLKRLQGWLISSRGLWRSASRGFRRCPMLSLMNASPHFSLRQINIQLLPFAS